jgi:hypothetical protein
MGSCYTTQMIQSGARNADSVFLYSSVRSSDLSESSRNSPTSSRSSDVKPVTKRIHRRKRLGTLKKRCPGLWKKEFVCDGWGWQRDDASIAVLDGNRVYGAACIVLFGLCFFCRPDGCVMLCHSFLSSSSLLVLRTQNIFLHIGRQRGLVLLFESSFLVRGTSSSIFKDSLALTQ